jgi:hypothetical protein
MGWYWEYIIQIIDSDNNLEERMGVVTGLSFSEAMESLEEYYKDELVEVKMLKIIESTSVFDFNNIEDDYNIDFTVSKREEE